MEQNVHLTPFILPTISRQLLIDYSDYNSKAKLLDRIFELSRQANTILELSTLASFVGQITAIDPKALMDTPTWKDDSPKTNMALYTDEVGLVRKFVHEIFRWHIEAPSGGQSDMAALCLQYICQDLKFAGPKFQKIREEMPELGPYETATITANNITGYYMVPICRAEYKERIKSHSMWLVQWYRTLSREIKMIPFVILDALSKSHSGEEMPFIYADFLPVVVFQCLNEFDKHKVNEFLITEAKHVFAAVKKDSPARREDISESCQTIFQLIDDLYRIVAKDAKTKKIKKELRSNLLYFIEESLKYRICPEDLMPASVEAAESCDNFYRAQRLLEQYSIKKDGRGVPGYDRMIFDLVQSLNFNLQEFENNEGAYAMILKNDKPTDLQTIKCAYARGDHHEILPMISGENREFMVHFLQLFNQPDLVISYIAQRFSPEERRFLKRDYPDVYQVQCQAAIELGKWELVDTELDRTEELIPKIDTMVDMREIGRNSGRNSEEIRIDPETSSITPETSGNEEDLLAFVSDTDEESENAQRENEKPGENGDNAVEKENAPSTDRKRAPDQDLTRKSKKTRLSSIANGSVLDGLNDTNMVFKNRVDCTDFVEKKPEVEITEDSSMMDNVVSGGLGGKNGGKKNVEILDESRIPGPEHPITDDLDRWELLEKYRMDTVTENAKRCYNDFEEGMRVLEPLTKWTPYEDYDPIYDPTEQHTFGADLTVILQKCRTKRFEEAKKHLSLAQVYLMKTLAQQGVDNTRPYSVGYEFVQDLHTLEDLKLAWPQLSDRSMENIWKKVDPNETQDSIMEISQTSVQGRSGGMGF
uniref:ANK_REP_REGION domain-containing protein n=1 Tax=Bursaphelenchus xylophilus TaxID=6326 RepID=A0A1I7RWM6_BURXY